MKTKIPDNVLRKACEIWKEMLADPVYDNGDNSFTGFAGSFLANKIPKNNTPEILEKFAEELYQIISGNVAVFFNEEGKEPQRIDFWRTLGVDYGADLFLQTAADRAGLNMQFPWKTNMYFNGGDNDVPPHFALGAGYAAELIRYYPMENGEWFITSLGGSDVVKVLRLVQRGVIDHQMNLYQPVQALMEAHNLLK